MNAFSLGLVALITLREDWTSWTGVRTLVLNNTDTLVIGLYITFFITLDIVSIPFHTFDLIDTIVTSVHFFISWLRSQKSSDSKVRHESVSWSWSQIRSLLLVTSSGHFSRSMATKFFLFGPRMEDWEWEILTSWLWVWKWQDNGSLIPSSSIPFSLIPFSLIPFSLIPFSLILIWFNPIIVIVCNLIVVINSNFLSLFLSFPISSFRSYSFSCASLLMIWTTITHS